MQCFTLTATEFVGIVLPRWPSPTIALLQSGTAGRLLIQVLYSRRHAGAAFTKCWVPQVTEKGRPVHQQQHGGKAVAGGELGQLLVALQDTHVRSGCLPYKENMLSMHAQLCNALVQGQCLD